MEILLADMQETFEKIRRVGMTLNPSNYVFEVPDRKFLGFIVSKWEIEADLEKMRAI